jgi:hypothetical protein
MRLIRRLYLEVLNAPPTPSEIEWYFVYNKNPYNTALNQVLKERAKRDAGYPTIKMKAYYETDSFKNKPPEKLTKQALNFINKLIEDAIAVSDGHPVDGFDYLSECLINRLLSAAEADRLMKEYQKHPDEKSGYLAVFNLLTQFEDFLFN